ncbi:WD40 repeat domain-containing protein [Vairimorpha necatrix]|uniref:WD40 repeat domain-containing protein n=1 Tax=Vairimorpha necatrix TaxID=6039 RepID=A0AAX4JCQ6_9MICR
MESPNLDLYFDDENLFVLRNKILYKYDHTANLIDQRPCDYIMIKKFINHYYFYDGSNIYKSSDLHNNLENITENLLKDKIIIDFYIYNDILYYITLVNDSLFYNDMPIMAYSWYDKYLFYSTNNGTYKVDLESDTHQSVNDVSATFICATKNVLIYSRFSKIYIDTGKSIRSVHRHDNSITNLFVNGNNLYVMTDDIKLSILDIYKDNLRNINEYISTNKKIIRFKDYIVLLNELELVFYNIEESKDNILYYLPNTTSLNITNEEVEEMHSVIIEPVYYHDDKFTDMKMYKDIIILTNNEYICSVYKIKRSLGIFYTGKSICVVFRNRVEVYKMINGKLTFMRKLKSIKQQIDDIIEKEDVYYYVSGKNLIKNGLINLVIDTEYKK